MPLPAPVRTMPERRGRGRTGRAGPLALGLLLLAAACAGAACSGGETAALAPPAAAESYDLVIAGGRVIDPESGLDAVRHVGIRDGAVAALSASPLEDGAVVDAAGLVVAPGFIDLHAHGQDPVSSRYQAQDGGDDGARARDWRLPGRELVRPPGRGVAHQLRGVGEPPGRAAARPGQRRGARQPGRDVLAGRERQQRPLPRGDRRRAGPPRRSSWNAASRRAASASGSG